MTKAKRQTAGNNDFLKKCRGLFNDGFYKKCMEFVNADPVGGEHAAREYIVEHLGGRYDF